MIKKLVALLLIITLIFAACSHAGADVTLPADEIPEIVAVLPFDESPYYANAGLVFTSLGDPDLLRYMEDTVYSSIVELFDSDDFFVENVSAMFLSNEYLQQLAFNSLENIYFGYTLSELDYFFQGSRYIFTLGDDGQNIARPFERYDDTFDRIVRNIATGTGVILLSVTVALVAPIFGATAVSVIFAKAAVAGGINALTGGLVSGGIAGVVTGVTTGNIDEALTAAALAASEGVMWGAITGVISGGVQTAIGLRGATVNGLTMNEAARLQRETRLPLDVIRQFHSIDEANFIIREVGLRPVILNGRTTLIRNDIDLNLIDDLGRTNLQRMGVAPLANGQFISRPLNPIYQDAAGGIRMFEWHHIGQRSNATLALLTRNEHDNPLLHGFLSESEIIRADFASQRNALNRAFGTYLRTNQY